MFDLPSDIGAERLPNRPRKGRGAVSNRGGRFEPTETVAIDDGWGRAGIGPGAANSPQDGPELAPSSATVIGRDSSRSIIARNRSPDVPFDRSINPYKGCEHGCVYCFARPTHAYLGLSPGLDFETRIFAKPDAAALLERELAKPGYRPSVLALGANTDPYQPAERELGITRGVLEVLERTRHPTCIVTKSALVIRDLDILAAMAERKLVSVMLSVTTLDRGLARVMEPRAPTPARRLLAVRALNEAGVPTGVLTAPIVPAINDVELESLLEAVRDAGAKRAGYVLLRLPLEIRDLFVEWLEAHFPERAARVMQLVRDTRAGKDYDSTYFRRQRGQGPYADLLAKRFKLACRRLGLNLEGRTEDLDCSQFRPPRSDSRQLSLL